MPGGGNTPDGTGYITSRDLMSAHRGSAGSTLQPATSEMRDLMSAQLGFLRGQPGTPQHELIASMSLWTMEFLARAA